MYTYVGQQHNRIEQKHQGNVCICIVCKNGKTFIASMLRLIHSINFILDECHVSVTMLIEHVQQS